MAPGSEEDKILVYLLPHLFHMVDMNEIILLRYEHHVTVQDSERLHSRVQTVLLLRTRGVK